MARTNRNELQGEWHHVWNRGVDREDIFVSDADRTLFEELIGEHADTTGVTLAAYCLMTNHVHLLLGAPIESVSQMMHLVGSIYAARFNRRSKRTGPLFGGRFGSLPITTTEHLVAESRYIDRNPLAFTPLRALERYRWSSLGCTTGSRPTPTWLDPTIVLDQFDGDPKRYLDFVERPLPTDAVPHRAFPTRAPDCCDIESAVARAADVSVESLVASRARRPNRPRDVAIALAMELRSASAEELRRRFGFETCGGVRNAARRARADIHRNASTRRLRERALQLVWQPHDSAGGVGAWPQRFQCVPGDGRG